MLKFKDFIFGFTWIITCEVIIADLGFSFGKGIWGKYLSAAIFGVANAIYFAPLQRKRSAKSARGKEDFQ